MHKYLNICELKLTNIQIFMHGRMTLNYNIECISGILIKYNDITFKILKYNYNVSCYNVHLLAKRHQMCFVSLTGRLR